MVSRYKYTQDWFYRSDLYCHNLLKDRISPSEPQRFLEIGSFEGLSATYFVDTFLNHEESRLVCVDPHLTTDTTAPVQETTEGIFLENIQRCRWPAKVHHVKKFSKDFFVENTDTFDFIYIDGSHLVEDLILDMDESYKICKVGGYILIDDYLWGNGVLKPCIDRFTESHDDIHVVFRHLQVLLRKSSPTTALSTSVHDDTSTLEHPSSIRLGLCMIVKNEAHIIHEVLRASLPFIDTYCIIDTGSTDDTIKVIEDFYRDTPRPDGTLITGLIESRPWRDFGRNRTELLDLCGSSGLMDYCMMMDADDLIKGPDGSYVMIHNLLSSMKPSSCEIHFLQPSLIEYHRKQIFKVNDGWRYVGVLHEYPTNGKHDSLSVRLPRSIHMVHRALGDRTRGLSQKAKFERDAEILLRGLEEEPDNDRYVFYLAQSYRDAGNIPKAIEYYKKRFEMGRWAEEAFVSGLFITRLTNTAVTDKDSVQGHKKHWAWAAHDTLPTRIESLYEYLKWVRENNKWSREALAMGLYALGVPKPKEGLFLETDVYDWKLMDEVSIIAYYCGRKDISKRLSEQLISENKMPESQRERIVNNLRFA